MTARRPLTTPPGSIGPIAHAPTYELVVDQIRRAIYLGRYLPGEKLPTERGLAEQLGVSRTTVREAVRLLEGEGLLTVRRGATGGLIVTGPREASAEELRSLLRNRQKELVDIFEYRIAVECLAATLAAKRRTKTDLQRIGAALRRMERYVAFSDSVHQTEHIAPFNAADAEFHIRIAEASQNSFLIKAVEEIRTAMFLPVGAIFDRLREDANAQHDVILAAIRDRDGGLASLQMRQHIEATESQMREFLNARAL
jgi:DNA-binding FadR family transcriptional regulator